MRLPLPAPLSSVPSPADVVGLMRRTASTADALLDTVPRLVTLLGEAEAFLVRAQGLVDRIEQTRADANGIVTRTAAVVGHAEGLLATVADVAERAGGLVHRVDGVVERTDPVVDRVDAVAVRAGTTVDEAEATATAVAVLSTRARDLLDLTEPSLVRLSPTLARLAETTRPEEADALVALVDLLPGLALRMETEVVPTLTSLGTVGPDIRDLLSLMGELNDLLASVPGLSRIKKRIDEEQGD